MKEQIWPYLAGLFDGEGCFSAWRYWNANRTDCKPYWQYSCRASVVNTNLQLMKWIVQHFGGEYRLAKEATAKHKARWEWRPKGKSNLKKMLLALLPYLVIKREQASLLLEWIDLAYGSQERRIAIIERINILNQKGSVETDTLNGSEEPKIQPELAGDCKSEPTEMLDS